MSQTIEREEAPAETSFEVRVHETPDAFDLSAWRDLLARDPDRHVFGTPEWHRVWWEEFAGDKELLVLEMLRAGSAGRLGETPEGSAGRLGETPKGSAGRGSDGATAAIVPLYRKREGDRKVLRFVGGIDLTDYLGPICALEDRRAVAHGLIAWLRTTDLEWDELDAHNMPVPLGFADFLVERADTCDFRFALDQEETAAVLPLPDDWDTYLSHLNSKERHELKRKRRRLQRDHPDAAFRTSTPETLEGDMKLFVDMHRGAEGHKGHFMRPDVATFFERMAHAFMPLGWLRLDFLEIGGRAVASTFAFELDRVLYLYNSAYEPEAGRLSPGLVLVSHLVEECIERGFEKLDFLRGPERYKYQLGSQAVPLDNVRVIRSGE